MRGRNVKCRLEQPIDTRTDTAGRTRIWPRIPEFYGALSPLSATEQELWERNVENASYRLSVMGRAIPEEHRAKVSFKNRVVLLNDRNPLDEEVMDIIGVRRYRRARRLSKFEIILGKIT